MNLSPQENYNELLIKYKALEATLSDAKSYLDDLKNFAPSPFCYVNIHHIILGANQSFADLSGYSESEILGESAEKVISKNEVEVIAEKIFKKQKVVGADAILVKKDQRKIAVVVSAMPRISPEGDVIGYFIFFHDISGINKIQDELRSKVEELGGQRLATLNVLEDVSDSRRRLESAHRMLEKKTAELEALKTLGDELTGVMDMDEAVNIISGYLERILHYSAAVYLVFNPIKEAGLIYSAHLKEAVSENFLAVAKSDIVNFLAGEKDDESKTALKVLQNLKPCTFGEKIDNRNKQEVVSKVLFPLRLGEYTLGAIHIASSRSGLARINNGGMVSAMLAAFSLSAARLHALIRSQHSRTTSLVENLNDGMVMFGRKKEVMLVNRAMLAHTGIARDNFDLPDFYGIFGGIGLEKMTEDVIAGKGAAHIIEASFNNKYFELSVTPVKDNREKIVGGAIILRDITHSRAVDRMKTEFVSVASHQLRTPLTAIKLFTEMMLNEESGKLNTEQSEYLHNIYQSTERMVRLVNDLLSLSRLESGRLRIEPASIRMEELARNVIAEIEPLAQTRGVKVDFTAGRRPLPAIPLDPDLVRQVVNNLVTNAVRYSAGKNGRVRVTLVKRKNEYVLSVKDNGIGIPEKVQPQIFNKFFRADNAVRAETEGTGLGLYVSKMIVESSGGKIWFRSEKGKGTEFFVSLPAEGMKAKTGDANLPGKTGDVSYS